MTQNNNFSPLPFYKSLDEQMHRRPYAYGDIYPLYCPVGSFPPFQFSIPSGSVTDFELFTKDDVSKGSLTIMQQIFTKSVAEGIMVICLGGSAQYSHEGQYYVKITAGGVAYYSDVFTAVADVTPYLKIEWWDDEDLLMDGATIVYDLGSGARWKNCLYLNAQLGKPEYEFEEEGERRDGLWFPEKMISEKTYKFTFLANEPLCDCMRLARMADYVKITDRYGNLLTADTFLITPKWEVQGNIASVEAEFQTNLVAKRIGRNFT